jgi:hypothetical protein
MTGCQTTHSCPGYLLLGATLWDTICLIRDQAALIPVVDLKYCNEVWIAPIVQLDGVHLPCPAHKKSIFGP